MSYKKVLSTLVFLVSILLVNLITTIATDWGFTWLKNLHPAKATMVGMGATVFILYPAFTYINKWSERVTKKIFNAGKNAAGKFLGLVVVFVLLVFILFAAYLKLWFNLWIWQVIPM